MKIISLWIVQWMKISFGSFYYYKPLKNLLDFFFNRYRYIYKTLAKRTVNGPKTPLGLYFFFLFFLGVEWPDPRTIDEIYSIQNFSGSFLNNPSGVSHLNFESFWSSAWWLSVSMARDNCEIFFFLIFVNWKFVTWIFHSYFYFSFLELKKKEMSTQFFKRNINIFEEFLVKLSK